MRHRFVISIGLVIVVFIGLWLALRSLDNPSSSNTPTPVTSLRDAHGLAVDRTDSSKVYIATHTGLLVMQNDKDLFTVGTTKDDYMGFSAHPNDANTFYASGHPSSGGNIGFQKSTDGGKTWEKVSNGANGPVDFHAMTVSQVDFNIVYGVYRGQLQRSNDEGKSWEIINTNLSNIITLTTSATNKDVVFAGTTDGLYTSQNQGQTWTKQDAINGAVTTIAVNPRDGQEMVAYEQNQGLMRSTDGGGAWNKLNGYEGGMIMHLAYDPQNPQTMYLINQSLEIYKATDKGQSWSKVR